MWSKSHVAIQFAHHVHDTSPQTSIFWIHASSRSRFEEAYGSIANKLELPGREDPSVNVLVLVRNYLQRDEFGPWLMIVDNVDDVNVFHSRNPTSSHDQQPLASFLPRRHDGIILVTSRSMDAADRLTGSHKAIYSVSNMNNAQALRLFRNKLKEEFDQDAAADLLRELNYIPLAIAQAAAYINRRAPRITVKKYLNSFLKSDKSKSNLLNRDAGDLRRDEGVSNSVITTWQVTFEQIRSERPSAADLLAFMSFFNPQDIPEFVLYDYKGNLIEGEDRNGEDIGFENDLDVLRGYSLVSIAATQGACEMHSLVQFCTQAWLSVVGEVDIWRQLFLRAMSDIFQ